MPYGTKVVSLYKTNADETVYRGETHTGSHTDLITLRRTLPSEKAAVGALTRTNVVHRKGFAVGDVELPVSVSIAVTMPKGVNTAAVSTYVGECLTLSAAEMPEIAVTGDIYLDL